MSAAWTEKEDADLRRLILDEGLSYSQAGRIMGRSKKSIGGRWNLITSAPGVRASRQRREAAVLVTRGTVAVPADVWAERNARMSEPISITAFVLGDPPASRSALAQRRA